MKWNEKPKWKKKNGPCFFVCLVALIDLAFFHIPHWCCDNFIKDAGFENLCVRLFVKYFSFF